MDLSDHTNFHFRAAAVAVTGTHILLHRAEMDEFWALPGGHIEHGESAAETLRREFMEEVGARANVGRLLWVVENFFDYAQQTHHEIGLYFLVTFAPGEPILQTESFFGLEETEPLIGHPFQLEFRWHLRKAQVLSQLPVLPVFLQQGLVTLPDIPIHIIERDN